MLKLLFFVYDGFAEFEIMILGAGMFGDGHQITTFTVGDDLAPVTSGGGFLYQPHIRLADVNPAEYDALIIPGGEIAPFLQDELLLETVRRFQAEDKVIGAICAGPALLANAGILEGRRYSTSLHPEEKPELIAGFDWQNKLDQDVSVDGKIVTAVGSAYVDFAVEIIEKLGDFTDEENKQGFANFFKNIK